MNLWQIKDRRMHVVFISGAFRGANAWEIHQNVLRAEKATAKLIGEGYAVICPHTMTQNLSGLYPDRLFLDMCLELLRRCDIIYMLEGWSSSNGSCDELEEAERLGLEVMYEGERDDM